MKTTWQAAVIGGSLLFARDCLAQHVRTRDMQVTQMPGIEEVKPDSDPAENASWGEPSLGFRLCVLVATNTFTVGEPLVAYAYLRNVTNRTIEYAIEVGLKQSPGCDFVLSNEKGEKLAYLPAAHGGFGSSRTQHLPALMQDRYWTRLDKIFPLSPGDFVLSATAQIVTPDGKKIVPVFSGTVALKILKQSTKSSQIHLPNAPVTRDVSPVPPRDVVPGTEAAQGAVEQDKLVPLQLRLPVPVAGSTVSDLQSNEHLEPLPTRPRAPLMVPAGVSNLSLCASVSSGDQSATNGALRRVVDGIPGHENRDDLLVLGRGLQWLQLDLGSSSRIYAIAVWHSKWPPKVFHDVIVQTADDPQFTQNVRILFNNDYDDTAGLGVGRDLEYYETIQGKLIAAGGLRARFIRLYSHGSTESGANSYLAVEVYGLSGELSK